MYKNRDDIQKLIESLTSGEKRNFSNLYKREGSTPLYVQIFSELEKGKSQLSKEISDWDSRSITAAKRRLYDNILNSLCALHDSSSVNLTLQKYLSSIEVLYSKGLAEQGLIIWGKAYALAIEHEKFALLFQVLDWEKRLNIVLDIPTRASMEIKIEENEILLKLQQILSLERLYSHIMLFKKKYGFVKGSLKARLKRETIGSSEMPREKDCLSNTAIYYMHLIRSVYYWMTFEHQQSYVHSKELTRQHAKNILPSDYIGGILQHITSNVCLGYFQDALDGINLGSAYIEEYRLNQANSFRSLMFAYQATYRIVVHQYMGNRNALLQTIKETESQLKDFETFLPLDMRQIIMGNLMNAYMSIGNLDKADKIWLVMNDKQFKLVRQDIHADLYLFRLFSLLHGKTYSLLPSASLSALRFYRKKENANMKYDVELPIAQLLQKERPYEKKETLREVMETVSQIVQQFISTMKGTNNFQEHYTRYVIWCDAIMRDEPYYEAAQRWHKRFKPEPLK